MPDTKRYLYLGLTTTHAGKKAERFADVSDMRNDGTPYDRNQELRFLVSRPAISRDVAIGSVCHVDIETVDEGDAVRRTVHGLARPLGEVWKCEADRREAITHHALTELRLAERRFKQRGHHALDEVIKQLAEFYPRSFNDQLAFDRYVAARLRRLANQSKKAPDRD